VLQISSISPITLEPPGLAIATARAGGVGILDLEFCDESQAESALRNLQRVLEVIPAKARPGLRLHASQVELGKPFLAALASRPHRLILCGWHEADLAGTVTELGASEFRELMVELTDIDQLGALERSGVHVDGIIGKGHEAGGWVGESPAFILAQQLLERTDRPVHIQGGIGPHTAAACYAAGAAGVVLDDQLWLMPESPMPRAWQNLLGHINGSEAAVLGERLGKPLRVLLRPGFAAAESLRRLSEEIEVSGNLDRWPAEAGAKLGWAAPDKSAWPAGQAIGLAAPFLARYRTTGRLIRAISKAVVEHTRLAQKLQPLAPDSPLARSHSTRFPIVQGPMTRVSDVAPFADAVSQAGALPMLALALMRGPRVRELLTECRERLGQRSWGVGILGFVPQELREEQLAVVEEIKPPFALIAGGRPEQAEHLEKQGIAAYIHVPTAALLEMFLARGARRFIFEGRECGGHVGPLTSFCLWETMIDWLLKVPPKVAAEMHVLFAGGIHDGRSGAMISAMAAPLAAQGMKIGVLMGTAYLFTKEAVENGAVVAGFQQEALKCTRTVNLETGPGHASRCCVTPFAREFFDTRRRLRKEGREAKRISDELESLTLGRLRVASKGILREGEALLPVDEPTQHQEGMYMIGQVATLRDKVGTIEDLHAELSQRSSEILSQLDVPVEADERRAAPSDIAIVGLSVLLPGAQEPEDFWANMVGKKVSLTEIPPERWDWRLYYDANRSARDKVYSKWGGFLDEVDFDPFHFGIPPNSLKSIEPMQLLALEATRRALVDAGYERGDFDREHTSVIFGTSGGMADLGQQYAARSEIPRMVGRVDGKVYDRLPEWTEESFPGLLFNVAAGRVANRFDFGGSNFTVDAACASSLAALDLAVRELESGRCNVAVAGGLDTLQSPFAYFCFSKTQALSPRGVVRTFDEKADGIVISEGVAVVVLKRLADAERDGDRIYSVLKALGSSSDGRSNSMTAPAPVGQLRALRRAYVKAGISPATLGLYEAHGTGTPVGDRAELESFARLLEENSAPQKSCVVGSAKTLVGHTKSSAGLVGVVKAALSLYRKVLPPHTGVEQPLERLRNSQSPVYLLKQAAPWLAHASHPRRAAVSAFGFGGTNFHAVLEEHRGDVREASPGGDLWPSELFVWRAADRPALQRDLSEFRSALGRHPEAALRDFAFSLARRHAPHGAVGLSIVAASREELASALDKAIAGLNNAQSDELGSNIQICSNDKPRDVQPPVALLFPGQGSQYPGMVRESALYIRELAHALEDASRQTAGCFNRRLDEYIFPPSDFSDDELQLAEQQLTQTHVAQPAIGAVSCGWIDFLRRLGLQSTFAGGHSFGEYTALHAAGAFSREEFMRLAVLRGRLMAGASEANAGSMAAVKASREEVLKWLGDGVVVANHNAPSQTVISGPAEAMKAAIQKLRDAKISVHPLKVSGAFHTSLMGSANSRLAEAIQAANIAAPVCTVFSNVGGAAYEADVPGIRERLCRHLLEAVEYVREIEAMYAAGVRVFIEAGPRSVLTSLVRIILLDREDVLAVSLDPDRGSLRGLLQTLGRLFIHGVEIDLEQLYEGRGCRELDFLAQTIQSDVPAKLSAQDWLVSGGSVRKRSDGPGTTGKLAPLTSTSAETSAKNGTTNSTPAKPTIRKAQTVNEFHETNGESSPSEPRPQEPPAGFQDGALAAYAAYQETMREFLKVQEEVMKHFLSGGTAPARATPQARPVNIAMPASAPAPKTPAPASIPAKPQPAAPPPASASPEPVSRAITPAASPAPPAASNGVESTLERESLTRNLLKLVSERTGYPTEVLGLDQDMEADLGIDSIKRVEIFGALQNQLNQKVAAGIQDQAENFTRVRTLKGWIDNLMIAAAA
jgi:acyl transferase domain-containing protein/NAD(P)H-dependent flavin oxidoreductase YrpB (nitropropane dioxygenase family)